MRSTLFSDFPHNTPITPPRILMVHSVSMHSCSLVGENGGRMMINEHDMYDL